SRAAESLIETGTQRRWRGGLSVTGSRSAAIDMPRSLPTAARARNVNRYDASSGGEADLSAATAQRLLLSSLNRSSMIGVSGGSGMRFGLTISPSTISPI